MNFRTRSAPSCRRPGWAPAAQFQEDIDLLRQMNNHSLEFLLFGRNLSQAVIFWPDRTAQAFFAAHWALSYGTPADLKVMQRWIGLAYNADKRVTAFDEFWLFVAEMPDAALKIPAYKPPGIERWLQIVRPAFTPPAELQGDFKWVRWQLADGLLRVRVDAASRSSDVRPLASEVGKPAEDGEGNCPGFLSDQGGQVCLRGRSNRGA